MRDLTPVSSSVAESPALRRLQHLDAVRPGRSVPSMGYQPGLDGLRAISVIAVILYHAGFGWMHGGFFGVEVFFVVSGFLITSLLIDEHAKEGRVDLRQFWIRRARRLLPALFAMLLAVGVWGALFASASQRAELKRDFPWAILYVGNWGQILGKVPYFSPQDPPLLRHLWSLGVEEQWYLAWPLVFVALMAFPLSRQRRGAVLLGASFALMLFTFRLARFPESAMVDHPISFFHAVDRVNFMYLSTFTRASGLLLGAAMAFVWRPWATMRAGRANAAAGSGSQRQLLDGAGLVAIEVLLGAFLVAHVTDRSVYRWLLPAVSIASLVAVLTIVHPAARTMRAVFGWRPLVEVGKRSYGLYLWHWPIFVIVGARHGGVARFVLAALVAVAVSEACYRYVETPVRRGALARLARSLPERHADGRPRMGRTSAAAGGLIVLLVVLGLVYVRTQPIDQAAGGAAAQFELSPSSTTPSVSAAATPPTSPRRVTIVGDSTAHALAVNLPDGIASTFTVTDGSLDGCSVYDDGKVVTSRAGFSRSFTNCSGWAARWAGAATSDDAQVALVVIGAWDVFDVDVDGQRLTFGSSAWDQRFLAHVGEGVTVLRASGAVVALLEVPCMRPVEAKGAGVPPLPERADDGRVAHVNALLRQAAASAGTGVRFVAGPTEWCNDPAIASDLGYRWDGVHVYKPGAKLIFETIAPALLQLPVTRQ